MTEAPSPRAVAFDRVSVGVEEPVPGGRPGDVRVRPILSDVTCALTEPTVSIVGANGSGKSTLLQLVNGLVSPDEGRVTVDGLDVAANGAQVRRRVGFVFTDPGAQLVMPTPLEDVELSLRRSVRNRKERKERALAVLDELGVADLAERSVYELSGGQRQLVALAAVLAVDPTVLVLDEPTTLLDLVNRELLRALLAELVERRGVRTIVSTHDLEVAADAERSLCIADGRLAADGAPAEMIAAYRELVLGGGAAGHDLGHRAGLRRGSRVADLGSPGDGSHSFDPATGTCGSGTSSPGPGHADSEGHPGHAPADSAGGGTDARPPAGSAPLLDAASSGGAASFGAATLAPQESHAAKPEDGG